MAATGTTVILGAGIIGLSTAYYLAQHQPPSTIHLVESSPELFASASGFAGGFLARDWFVPGSSSLGALSFDEHKRLAAAHDGAGRWGYQKSTSISYDAGDVSAEGGKRKERGEDWLFAGTSRASAADDRGGHDDDDDRKQQRGVVGRIVPSWLRRRTGDSTHLIGDEKTTAQLDPAKLCQFLLDECIRQGVHLHHPAKAVAVMTDMRNELSSVRIEDTSSSTETDIPCTRLIIAAGAWSAQVFAELFPKSTFKLPISSLAGHSLVLRSPRWTGQEETGCHAIFTNVRPGYSPEAFSRVGGEIWIGGRNSSTLPLPSLATEREVQEEAIAELKQTAALLLGPETGADDLEILRESLCFRPVTPSGTPVISRIQDGHLGGLFTRPEAEGGVFLAAGHGPWGISLSLGTGIVLSEMVQGRPLSADVSSLTMR